MNLHSLLGWVSSALFIITLWGGLHQTILLKKLVSTGARDKFSNLSASYFFAYFLGVFLFFSYGYFLPEEDYFLAVTRGAATCLAVSMLTFLWLGKKSASSFCALLGSVLCIAIAVCLMVGGKRFEPKEFQYLKVGMSCVTIYGIHAYTSQIKGILAKKSSLGLSKVMNFTVAMKDLSVIAYGFTYTLNDSWPLIAQAVMNGSFRITLLYLCYRYANSARSLAPQSA
jgi:hypothetical protein